MSYRVKNEIHAGLVSSQSAQERIQAPCFQLLEAACIPQLEVYVSSLHADFAFTVTLPSSLGLHWACLANSQESLWQDP